MDGGQKTAWALSFEIIECPRSEDTGETAPQPRIHTSSTKYGGNIIWFHKYGGTNVESTWIPHLLLTDKLPNSLLFL